MIPDMPTVKRLLSALSYSENMGDVNDVLPYLCKALDLPTPQWNDDDLLYVMAWDV